MELERPAAYHTSPIFPPHTFRNGDLARIEPNVVAATKKPSKKAAAGGTEAKGQQVEGVVYRVGIAMLCLSVSNHGCRCPIPRSSSPSTPPTQAQTTSTSPNDAASSSSPTASHTTGTHPPNSLSSRSNHKQDGQSHRPPRKDHPSLRLW